MAAAETSHKREDLVPIFHYSGTPRRGVPGNQVGPHSTDGHNCGVGVRICNRLQHVCHPLASSLCTQSMLEKRCCLFYLLGNLFCHGTRHEPPHGVPIDSSPGASIWLAQCSEASQSEPCQNFCGDVSCGLGRTDPSHGLIPKQAKGGQTSTPMDQPRCEKAQNQVVPNGSGAEHGD